MTLSDDIHIRPTPLVEAPGLSKALGCRVLVKRDDLTHPLYGGNKIRKLRHYLLEAQQRNAGSLVTVGARGSHHALATAHFGLRLGFEVHVVLVPHPDTARATAVQAEIDGLSAHTHRVETELDALKKLARLQAGLSIRGQRPFFIPPGGTSPLGARGYDEAVDELAAQMGGAGWPDVTACALGSGGTFAGLMAGLHRHRAPTRLLGVAVRDGWLIKPASTTWMAERVLAHRGAGARLSSADPLFDHAQIGGGYGVPTPASREAVARFADDGIALEDTYSGKAAAGLIALLRREPGIRSALFWNTYCPVGGVQGGSSQSPPPR